MENGNNGKMDLPIAKMLKWIKGKKTIISILRIPVSKMFKMENEQIKQEELEIDKYIRKLNEEILNDKEE